LLQNCSWKLYPDKAKHHKPKVYNKTISPELQQDQVGLEKLKRNPLS